MHSFEYILIMIAGVLISSLISQKVSRLSLPLIQIAIGVALTLLPLDFNIVLDPELFLVLFIAPLLFDDAKRADKAALWRQRRPVLMLAIGLVFITTLIVGAAIHLYTPSIPLAAAFALAAALAPTDAVAVASLSENSTVSSEQGTLLKGESLLNDAASIVSFHFALAAVITGSFSLLNATGSFLLMFFGGVAVGALLMLARYFSIRKLRASGFENTTFFVLFEIVTPCLVFLVAEALQVSSIIAVVTAGIVYSYAPRPLAPINARHSLVSSSVWSVIAFTLNGLVFLILGTQLPNITQHVWVGSNAASFYLIPFIVFILLAILALRFIWVLVMQRNVNLAAGGVEIAAEQGASDLVLDVGAADDQELGLVEGFGRMDEQERDFTVDTYLAGQRQAQKQDQTERRSERQAAIDAERRAAHADPHYWRLHLHDALLLTLTGAKGAITLAVLLTIPINIAANNPFPERDLILFLASGVILLSLILTNVAVPLIAPKQKQALPPESELAAMLEIYRTVIYQLAESVGDNDKTATNEVIQHYTSRLQTLRLRNQLADPLEDQLRTQVIDWETEHTLELIDEGKVSTVIGLLYLNQLSHIKARVEHHNSVGWEARGIVEQLRHRMSQGKQVKKAKQKHRLPALERISRKNATFELRRLVNENLRFATGKLTQISNDETVDEARRGVAEQMIVEFQRRLDRGARNQARQSASQQVFEQQLLAVQMRALAFERDAIESALSKESISREQAKIMRDNVAMMELDIEEQLE